MTEAGITFRQRVENLLYEAFESHPELFLIDLEITPDYSVKVTIDGDRGVNLQDCMDVSRTIEHSLDREEFDFSLEVGSAGAGSPLKLPRQYTQHIGRTLKVFHQGTETEGVLSAANMENITLSWSVREPKPIGKGKHTVQKELVISFVDIEKATVVLKF